MKNKKVIQESYYTPKLNLKFEPPITNDSFGVSKVDKILNLIDNLYPNTKWWYGGKPSEYNPFLHPVDDEDDDSGYPEEICNFIIGYRDDFPNRITYGLYCDDSYGNEIDGYKWLQDNETNYDETEGMFNQLNESVEFDLGLLDFDTYDVFNQLNEDIDEDDVPKITYVFEPPIEDRETLESVLYAVGNEHPNITWPTGAPILSYDVYREIFIDNEGYDFVGGLSIFPSSSESGPDTITWTSWVDPRGSYSDYGPKADGWQLLEKTSNLDTDDMFNQLNEGRYQPKLNLRFEDGISDADELDKILQVLAVVYPGLTWLGGNSITTHNVIRAEEDFEYEPIYYLTIGFFPTSSDKLTYTSAPDDDRDFADDEHHNFKWVDGWQWVRDNEVNYDETDDMFQQLNEALEYDENNPLHKFDIFLDKTNTTSDIKYILDLYKESGIPSNKKDEWADHDIDYCYEWFLNPKKGGEGMIIGTGLTSKGYYIYWQGISFKFGSKFTPKVRNSMGTNKELITFDRFLELTAFDDDPFGTGFDNIFG